MSKLKQAARQALEALELDVGCPNIVAEEAITALREALAEQAEQEPFDMDDHPPHRLCECRKCMEYFTPLPDCDAFAASGKPIAEQTNTQFMEGYRIGLAEMREKCATVSEQGTGEAVQKAALELLLNERKRIAAAIRAIKFEGDTGFRPVSEMIAEHKQAEQEPVVMDESWCLEPQPVNGLLSKEQAEQEPMYISKYCVKSGCACHYSTAVDGEPVAVYTTPQPVSQEPVAWKRESDGALFSFEVYEGLTPLYTAPQPVNLAKPMNATEGVREVELTDDEITNAWESMGRGLGKYTEFARAVIAADREKNK